LGDARRPAVSPSAWRSWVCESESERPPNGQVPDSLAVSLALPLRQPLRGPDACRRGRRAQAAAVATANPGHGLTRGHSAAAALKPAGRKDDRLTRVGGNV